MDLGVGLAEALPTGLYSGCGIGDYVDAALADAGRVNDFRLLDRELYLTATDLDTCERIVFGEEGWDDVPISKAIQCSTALPIVYKPVDLKGRQLVDGGIRSTTNVDIAVEKGAKFIVVVNPLVPYVNDFEKTIPTMLRHPRAARLRHGPAGDRQPDLPPDRPRPPAPGGRAVAGEYPGVDIILVEPEPNDELMFGTPIMDYSRRLQDRPPRLRIGHRDPRPGLRALRGDRQAPRPRDLRPPRQPRGRAGRRRGARADLRLAPRARADDLGAAASVRRGLLAASGCPR